MKQLLFIVLNRTECLDDILEALADAGCRGATILESRGMAHALYDHEDMPFMASLRMFLDPERKESRTIFLVLDEEKIPVVSKIVNGVTGGLDRPDTGVIFTVPVQYTEGFGDK